MTTDFISQEEANRLLQISKVREDENEYTFPSLGGNLRIPLSSIDKKEEFSLDIGRSCIKLIKNKYQTRVHKNIVLVRIDIGGSPHRNPDGEEIDCPHIHIYKEGYGVKWAYTLPEHFHNPSDPWTTLLDFYTFCNITKAPIILQELFT